MAVGINTNVASLRIQSALSDANNRVSKSMQALSTGLRINTAGDDSAGLAISERMTAQLRGSNQAARNMNDAISLVQTTEGALGEVTSMLQRARELSVQAANSTNSGADLTGIQNEISQLFDEIDRIAQTTEFNNVNLLNGPGGAGTTYNSQKQFIIEGLRNSWLQQSEDLIQTYYGLSGDGASLEIVFDETAQPYAAAVSGNFDGNGKLINQTLHIDLEDFPAINSPDGGTAPFYSDRIIAHEMVHAVMGRTMNFDAMPTWFLEGAAEFIHGADERLAADIAANGGGAGGADAVVAAIGDGTDGAWGSASIDYSTGYAAVRYMHEQIKAAGGDGIKDIMTYLNANQSADLDEAITNASSGAFTDFADFLADYKGGNGSTYIQGLDLANDDTGAIGGADADGGATRTATSVIPDSIAYTKDPLSGFEEIWPDVSESSRSIKTFTFQVGANVNETINVSLTSVNASSLGLSSVNVQNNAGLAIDLIDVALDDVSTIRAELGATQNRLTQSRNLNQTASTSLESSRSRIVDADFAQVTAELTQAQIVQQASISVLAQANSVPQLALQLLSA